MTHFLAIDSCSKFPLFFPLPVSFLFFPYPKCKKASLGTWTFLPTHAINAINAMPRKDNDDDRRRRGDEDNDEQRRRREDEKKRMQRKKKARRPDLADTPADLGVEALFDADSHPQGAESPAAVEDPNLGELFAPAASEDEDELLKSSAAEDEEEEAPSFDDDEEGMDVDDTNASPSPPSVPNPPEGQPRSGTILCHKEAPPTEVEVGPTGEWAPSRLADGSIPETTREIGCQANVGLERLARRQTWLKASRRRYRLNRLKRRREASLPPPAPVPEAAPVASDPPVTPQAKRPRPSYLLPKKSLSSTISPPSTSQGHGGATGGREAEKKGAVKRGQSSKPKRGRGGKGGQVAKDQRVVVFIPPEDPTTSSSRSPRETARVSARREVQNLPQTTTREPPKRGRSLSKSRQDEVGEKKRRCEKREVFPRQRSPSPGPSSRRSSLPPSMPTPFSMDSQQWQWMATAMITAFEAHQRFQQQQQQQQEQEQEPPQSSSSRSRSTTRKGKGPGKGKGRGRGK